MGSSEKSAGQSQIQDLSLFLLTWRFMVGRTDFEEERERTRKGLELGSREMAICVEEVSEKVEVE